MSLVNVAALGCILVGVVACNGGTTLSGSAQVLSNFEVNEKPKSGSKIISIPYGNYNFEIEAKKDSAKIKLLSGSEEIKFKINFPGSSFQGDLYKDFDLGPASLGQEMYLKGIAGKKVVKGKTITKDSSCVYDSYSYTDCTPGHYESCFGQISGSMFSPTECQTGDSFAQYWVAESCSTQTQDIYGTQKLTGYDTKTTDTMTIELRDSSKKKVAKFNFPAKEYTGWTSLKSTACVR